MPETRTVHVPLDLSEITDAHPGDRLKVVARTTDGVIVSDTVDAHEDSATAKLTFDTDPGNLTIAVGPPDVDDLDILDSETLRTFVPGRLLDVDILKLTPLKIGPWYWGWWRRWCRTITVKGRVVCPDGRPVPGATVTVFDVDWWWWWSSRQRLDSVTTDVDGTFSMTFTWCCGLYPWPWWFQMRSWKIDPIIQQVIGKSLERNDIELDASGSLPSLQPFSRLLGDIGRDASRDLGRDLRIAPTGKDRVATPKQRLLADVEPAQLDKLRDILVERLPRVPELERVGIWPWVPWRPWMDCRPDLVFTVTQRCGNGEGGSVERVVLDEGYFQTRWDVPDAIEVALVTNDTACCAPEPPTGQCMSVTNICGFRLDSIGGHDGSPAAPSAVDGYRISYGGTPSSPPNDDVLDQPFAGVVTVHHNASTLDGIDFYGIEHSTDAGLTWTALPVDALLPMQRDWQLFPGPTYGSEAFGPISVGPYEVFETWRHRQDTTYGDWTPVGGRTWMGADVYQLARIDTTRLPDGTHRFRVIQFDQTGADEYGNARPVQGCGDQPVEFVLAIDNRTFSAPGSHNGHVCGTRVHLCTAEPETHITTVTVDGHPVGPCDVIGTRDGMVTIDFVASDVDGHLDSFSLTAHYGLNGYVDLLAQPGATLTSLSAGPAASSYPGALALGATRPDWPGGTFRLSLPTNEAFPEPCCYLLRLVASTRVIENCQQGQVYNVTEMTLGVGV